MFLGDNYESMEHSIWDFYDHIVNKNERSGSMLSSGRNDNSLSDFFTVFFSQFKVEKLFDAH